MNSYSIIIASADAMVGIFVKFATVRKCEQYVKNTYPGFRILSIATKV